MFPTFPFALSLYCKKYSKYLNVWLPTWKCCWQFLCTNQESVLENAKLLVSIQFHGNIISDKHPGSPPERVLAYFVHSKKGSWWWVLFWFFVSDLEGKCYNFPLNAADSSFMRNLFYLKGVAEVAVVFLFVFYLNKPFGNSGHCCKRAFNA